MDYKEDFYNQLTAKLVNVLGTDTIQLVQSSLTDVLQNYTLSPATFEVVPYQAIPDCLVIYLASQSIAGLSKLTLGLYKNKLENFFRYMCKPLENITQNDIRLYLNYLEKSRNNSNRTRECTRSIICRFFKWATAEGYIDKDPAATITKIKYAKYCRDHLSELELERFRNATTNLRDKALVEVLSTTGCRVSEVIGMKRKDLQEGLDSIYVFGKGAKERQVYLGARAVIALKAYLESRNDDSEYLFVSRIKPYNNLTKRAVEKIVEDIGVRAGIKYRVYPHLIRHTLATLFVQRGGSIEAAQKLLGHENINTTMIYAHVADKAVQDAHKRFVV